MTQSTLLSWHDQPWQRILASQSQNRLPHALLISGLEGTGKKSFAERLVSSVLCSSPDAQFNACQQCHSCQLLAAGTHPDHTVISPEEAGKQIKIDQIRDLKASQSLMPKVSSAKTVVITAADQLNTSSFNSLLKLLEEPQPNSVIILLSRNKDQLPITIKSRCQNVLIPTPETEEALHWLKQTDMQLNDEQWQILLKMTQGAPLAAMTLGEAGLQQYQQVIQDIALLMRSQANPISLAAEWQKLDLKSVLLQIQAMMQAKITSLLQPEKAASSALIRQYWAIVDCITHTIKLISSQNNPNKTLLIEDFMVTVMHHADQIQQLQGMHR